MAGVAISLNTPRDRLLKRVYRDAIAANCALHI